MHSQVQAVLRQFHHVDIPEDRRKLVEVIRGDFERMAGSLALTLQGPDATVALRSLMRAKDDAIRAAIFGG